jgi:hypothetical protein
LPEQPAPLFFSSYGRDIQQAVGLFYHTFCEAFAQWVFAQRFAQLVKAIGAHQQTRVPGLYSVNPFSNCIE